MKILEEALPDHRVSVDTDADLFEHGIDVGRELVLPAFSHYYHNTTSILDVHTDVLQLLSCERHLRSSQKKEMTLSEAL